MTFTVASTSVLYVFAFPSTNFAQCDEAALFQKMKKIKSDIDNLKSVDVTSLPSAKYNRKSLKFSDVEKLFGNVTFQ
jgi:hypothetical protein